MVMSANVSTQRRTAKEGYPCRDKNFAEMTLTPAYVETRGCALWQTRAMVKLNEESGTMRTGRKGEMTVWTGSPIRKYGLPF